MTSNAKTKELGLVLALVLTHSVLLSAEPISNIVNKWQKQFAKLDSLECTLQRKPKLGFTEKTNYLVTFRFAETSEGYFYSQWQQIPATKASEIQGISSITSYTSGSFQRLADGPGYMVVQKEKPRQINCLTAEEFITSHFRFLIETKKGDISTYPSIFLINKNLDDPELISRIVSYDAVKRELVITAGVDDMTGLKIFYKVQLDRSENYMPVYWLKLDENKRPIMKYSVIKKSIVRDIKGFEYQFPLVAELECYDASNRVTFSYNYLASGVEINNTNEVDLSIDPSKARFIRDADSGRVIKVPR